MVVVGGKGREVATKDRRSLDWFRRGEEREGEKERRDDVELPPLASKPIWSFERWYKRSESRS